MQRARLRSGTGAILVVWVLTVFFATVQADSRGELKVHKASFKTSYVEDEEKVARARITSEGATIASGDVAMESVEAKSTDSISVQVSVVDQDGDGSAIEQSFLRIENKRTGKDNIYVMRKRGLDIKTDIDLTREIRADKEFWQATDAYIVQVILGDRRLSPSFTWTITTNMRFIDPTAAVFAPSPRGVFDFDVSVKTNLLPEFEFPLRAGEKRAPFIIVVLALIAVFAPLPLLLVVWFRMGVLPLRLPSKDTDFWVTIGLHACIALHMASLAMFWVQWNIITTWKVMAVIMVPTLAFVRLYLKGDKLSR